jgi:hypothetical protein
MAREDAIFKIRSSEPVYVNGKVVKVHEEDIYDVRLLTGQVESYIENVSSSSFNSGDYVAVLIIGQRESRVCKIIGRGRKISESSSIKKVII